MNKETTTQDSLSLPIGRRALPGGAAALATPPVLASVVAEAALSLPTGLDAKGHFQAVTLSLSAFAHARLREGAQWRVNGVSKNLMGPTRCA